MDSVKPITMPFTYNNTDLTDVPVETYTDLLEVVEKAVFLFPEDTNIKEFRAWLQQLPDVDSDDGFSEGDENPEEEEYPAATYETLEDSCESQEGIIDILGAYLEIYVIKKKLWALSNRGLVLLCNSKDDPRLATVPLFDPNFDAWSLVGGLIPYYDIFQFLYAIDDKLCVIMTAPDSENHGQPRTVEWVINTSTAPDHEEFERSFKAGTGGVFTAPTFRLIVTMNNHGYFARTDPLYRIAA